MGSVYTGMTSPLITAYFVLFINVSRKRLTRFLVISLLKSQIVQKMSNK